MMTLGKRLKQLRAQDGRTQEEIALSLKSYKIKADRGTLARWENDIQTPTLSPVMALAKIYGVTTDYIISGESTMKVSEEVSTYDARPKPIRIPVLGSIPAGTPIEAIEEILDWEELDPREYNSDRQYFGLVVRGDSMFPVYLDGDVIIVEKCSDADSSKDVVAYVNGYEGTLKRLYKFENGSIELRAINPAYDSKKFTQEEIEEIPVVICGIVKELRRKI